MLASADYSQVISSGCSTNPFRLLFSFILFICLFVTGGKLAVVVVGGELTGWFFFFFLFFFFFFCAVTKLSCLTFVGRMVYNVGISELKHDVIARTGYGCSSLRCFAK